ncbi:MAG: glycerol-3-phosphate acyltransferase [Chloroflexia bacterium]
MSDFLLLLAVTVGAYLIGAIPSGLLISRLKGRDPLSEGSGKTGATNTFRTAGPAAGAIVLVLDLVKGFVSAFIARLFAWPDEVWASVAVGASGAAAIIGHNWSVWVRLLARKWGGGRGIMTAFGAMLTVSPWVALAALLAGGATIVITRYMAWGALVGAVAGVGTVILLGVLGAISPWLVPGAVLWGLLVILGFHDNIGRLFRGAEPKLGT